MTTFRVLTCFLLTFFMGCTSGMHTVDVGSFQTGEITVPHAQRPTDDSWTLVYTSHVTYPRAFRNIPRVQLSVVAIEAYSRNSGTFYRVEAKQVTTTGFEFHVYAAYMRSFSNCTVAWTAIES